MKISETQKYCELELECVVWCGLSPVAIFRLLDCVVWCGLSPVAIFILLDCVVWCGLSPVAIFRLLDCLVWWGLSPVAIFRLQTDVMALKGPGGVLLTYQLCRYNNHMI